MLVIVFFPGMSCAHLFGQSAVEWKDLAQSFRDSSQWDSAEYCYLKAMESFVEDDLPDEAFKTEVDLQAVYISAVEYNKADSGLQILMSKAQELFAPDDLIMGRLYDMKGELLFKQGSYKDALPFLHKALLINKLNDDNQDAVSQTHNVMGSTWRSMGVLDSALYHYQQSLAIREDLYGINSKEAAVVWDNIAIVYRIRGDHKKALEIYQRNDSIFIAAYGPDHPERAAALNGMGILHAQAARYPEALECFSQLLEIDKKSLSPTDPNLAATYTNLGILYELMGDLSSAQDLHKQSLAIKLQNFAPDNPALIYDYKSLSVVYDHMGDIDQALLFRNQVIQMEEEAFDSMDSRLGVSYSMLASTLRQKGDFEEALAYHRKAEIIFKANGDSESEVGPLYHSMARVFQQQEKLDSAKIYARRALQTNLRFEKDHPYVAGNYQLLGDLEKIEGNPDSALILYKEAIRIYEVTAGDQHQELAHTHMKIARVATDRADFPMALHHLQLALNSVCDTIVPTHAGSELLTQHTRLHRTVASILAERGKVYQEQFEQTQDPALLRESISSFDLAAEMIKVAQFSYHATGSVVDLRSDFDSIYSAAIEVGFDLYDLTGENQYLDKAFQFSEQNKSALLISSLNESRARDFGKVPADVLKNERELKRNLTYYEHQLDNENDLSPEEAAALKEKIFILRSDYDNLVANIEESFPEYYALKYKTDLASLEAVQKSLHDEVFIEYFIGNQNIYAFVVSRKGIDGIELNIPTGFLDSLHQFRSCLADPNTDIRSWTSLSSHLYRTLLHPLEAQFDSYEQLIIVPDSELGYIPFEVLTSDSEGDQSMQPGYLLRRHSVNYAFSATYMLQAEHPSEPSDDLRYIAFTPSFNHRSDTGNPEEPNLLAYHEVVRGNLSELKGARVEVESLNRYFDGVQYDPSTSFESIFKQTAHQFDIIHLATHAIIDEVNPLNSRMLFTIDGDSIDDGDLHAWELFEMELDADLAVLSACNTGFGRIQKGEGVQSLGRAFAYAGVPSRLMSLWPAQDASTARIMSVFYENLADGMPKDEALRRSKLAYLEEAADFNQHPFYWAGFILQGNPAPLVEKSPVLLYLLGVVLLALIGWFVSRRLSENAT